MKHKTNIRLKALLVSFFFVLSLSAGIWFGYGNLPPGASQTDLDGDGIPDWLEVLLDLNPNDSSDGIGDIDIDETPNNVDTSYGDRTITTIYPIPGERLP